MKFARLSLVAFAFAAIATISSTSRAGAVIGNDTLPKGPVLSNSDTIPCAPGTVFYEQVTNAAKLTINLCAIPSMDTGAYWGVKDGNSYAVVNSRVSGSFYYFGLEYTQVTGSRIKVSDSFRPYYAQKAYRDCYEGKSTYFVDDFGRGHTCNTGSFIKPAIPGKIDSNHENGLAIDIDRTCGSYGLNRCTAKAKDGSSFNVDTMMKKYGLERRKDWDRVHVDVMQSYERNGDPNDTTWAGGSGDSGPNGKAANSKYVCYISGSNYTSPRQCAYNIAPEFHPKMNNGNYSDCNPKEKGTVEKCADVLIKENKSVYITTGTGGYVQNRDDAIKTYATDVAKLLLEANQYYAESREGLLATINNSTAIDDKSKATDDDVPEEQETETKGSVKKNPPIDPGTMQAGSCVSIFGAEYCKDGDDKAVKNVLKLGLNIMTAGVAVVGVIGIIICGYLWLTARNDESQVAKAKRRLIEVVVGLVAWLLFALIAQFILPDTAAVKDAGISAAEQSLTISSKDK